jgi:hypothetical protein
MRQGPSFLSLGLLGLAVTTSIPSSVRAADHLLAPSHTAGTLMKLFDAKRRQAGLSELHVATGAICQPGYVCVTCLANCNANGSVIVQMLQLQVTPKERLSTSIEETLFHSGIHER